MHEIQILILLLLEKQRLKLRRPFEKSFCYLLLSYHICSLLKFHYESKMFYIVD